MAAEIRGDRKRRGAPASGLNPGITAAGSEARMTALDPSAGPAAIGGMLSTTSSAVDPATAPTAPQARLTSVVTDITKLANAMEVLSIIRPEGGPEFPLAMEAEEGRAG